MDFHGHHAWNPQICADAMTSHPRDYKPQLERPRCTTILWMVAKSCTKRDKRMVETPRKSWEKLPVTRCRIYHPQWGFQIVVDPQITMATKSWAATAQTPPLNWKSTHRNRPKTSMEFTEFSRKWEEKKTKKQKTSISWHFPPVKAPSFACFSSSGLPGLMITL